MNKMTSCPNIQKAYTGVNAYGNGSVLDESCENLDNDDMYKEYCLNPVMRGVIDTGSEDVNIGVTCI